MTDVPSGHPESPEEARELIEERKETVEEAYESENDFIQGLAKNYDRDVKRDLDTPAQVIPELLQNADDVEECRTVEIRISDDELCIRNDGRPLAKKEFRALCHIGESTKQKPGYIGHFGRGFKSVFSVTDNPKIRSGYFRFQFHRERCVLPEHLNTSTDFDGVTYGSGTDIRLPLKDLSEHERNQLERQIDEIHRLMPYLRHISDIYVDDRGTRTHYRRDVTERDTLSEVEIYKDGLVSDRRHIFSVERVPPSDEFAELVAHRDLENVEAFRGEPVPIQLSVPVDEDGNPTSTEEAGRLVNFFPTQRELNCPFDIQADFLLDSDRSQLKNTDGPYNIWVFKQVGDAYEKAVNYYLDQNPPSDSFLDILPTRVNLESPLKRVQRDMIAVLQGRSCIPGRDSEWYLPSKIIVPEDDLDAYLSEDDLEQILGDEVQYPADFLSKKQLESFVRIGLLEKFSVKDLVEKGRGSQVYRKKSPKDLLQLVSLFNGLWEDTYKDKSRYHDGKKEFIAALKETPLIPVQDGEVVSIEERDSKPVLPPEKQATEYEIFVDRVTLVNLASEKNRDDDDDDGGFDTVIEDVRSLFRDVLGLEVISETYVITKVIASTFEDAAEEDDETLDAYLEFIRETSSRQQTAIDNDVLRFRAKTSGAGQSAYRDPEELFMPDAFDLTYSLETLLESEETAEFVTPAYIELDGTKGQWQRFLRKAGVQYKLRVDEQSESSREKFKNRQDLGSYLESVGDDSTTPPEATKKTGGRYDKWLDYYQYALSDYSLSDTFTHVLETIEKERSATKARQLARLLSEEWDYYSNRSTRLLYYVNRRGQGNPYRADEEETNAPTSFIETLRETSWCPTEAGTLRPPSALLVESPQTQGQNDERYIDEDLPFSTEIYDTLGIRTRLTPEAVRDLLAQAPAVWGDEDPSTIRSEITAQVDQLKAELVDEPKEDRQRIISKLREAPFIYVESALTQFRTPQQVVLQGISLGDRLVSISNLYDRHHGFFSEHLNVRERVGLEDCLTLLADCAGDELSEEYFKAWNGAVRQFVSEMDSLNTEEFQSLDSVERLRSQEILPTQIGQTARLSTVDFFCPDTGFLDAITTEDIRARTIREPKGSQVSQERLTQLWKRFDLTNLQDEVNLELIDDSVNPDVHDLNLVSDDERLTKLLAVCQIYLRTRDEPLTEDLETVDRLADYQLSEHSAIRGHYTLDGDVISDSVSIPSYVDRQSSRLLKTEDIESYYHLASELAKTFSLSSSSRKDLNAILTGAVGTEVDLLEAYLESQGIEPGNVDVIIERIGRVEPEEKDEDAKSPEKEPTSAAEEEQSPNDTSSSQSPDRTSKENESTTKEKSGDRDANRQTNETTGSTSSNRSTGDISKAASGGSSYSRTTGNTGSSTAERPAISKATFGPDISPSDIDSKTLIENRPATTDSSSPGSGSGGGGGGSGGGGQAAEDIGLYGEELVVAELTAIVREEFAPERVRWHWNPEFVSIEDVVGVDDNVESRAILNSTSYGCTASGVEIELQGQTIRILHIRDAKLGADILVEGLSFDNDPATDRLLTPRKITPDAEAWVEVKSTQHAATEFPLTIGEYGRAREEQDDYHIIRLCRVGSTEMYVDRQLTDLGTLLEDDEIRIETGSLQLKY